MNVKKILKPTILETSAYHVPTADGLVKLDAMENPYVWPDVIKEQWASYLKQVELNRYPDANMNALKQKVKQNLALPENIDVLFGNGSDELIQIILLALNKESNVVMALEPSFIMYRLLSTMFELNYIGISLEENFSLDLEKTLNTIRKEQPSVFFIAYPNNPTGNVFVEKDIEEIINVSPGLVIIDEAYFVFAQKTMLSYLETYPNVLIMRTFSKLGLAGLRLGMLFGNSEWIFEFNKIRLPYNIGTLNQLSMNFILDHIEVLEQQADKIRKDRDVLLESMRKIDGINVWKSEANFILFKILNKNANVVHEELLNNKILIKNLNGAHPLLESCLRVTVGTKEENALFLKTLKKIIS